MKGLLTSEIHVSELQNVKTTKNSPIHTSPKLFTFDLQVLLRFFSGDDKISSCNAILTDVVFLS